MTTVLNARPAPLATEKQASFLLKLARERVWTTTANAQERVNAMQTLLDNGMSKQNASRLITDLLQRPLERAVTPSPSVQRGGLGVPGQSQPQPKAAVELTPGVYDVDNHVYVVKFNRAKTHLYAKRLVEITSDRLAESGDYVQIEFVYAPGVIATIKPEHRMDFERAKALTIRYGRCINCGRQLKAAKSVELGIGPVCRKSFA